MTRAAAAAVDADIGTRATGIAGAGVDDGGRGEDDDNCGSSALKFSSWAYRMWKVK